MSRISLGKLGTLSLLAYSKHHSVICFRKRTEAVETKGPGTLEQRREAGSLTLPVPHPWHQLQPVSPEGGIWSQLSTRHSELLKVPPLLWWFTWSQWGFHVTGRGLSLKQVPYGKNNVPLLNFCTFRSHNVSGSQQGLKKSLLSVTGQNTDKGFRTCNEAISWHPGHVTLQQVRFLSLIPFVICKKKKNRPNMEPSNTRRKPIMSSNACESSSVYLNWTWTKLWNCSYGIQPQDGTIGPLKKKKTKTTQPQEQFSNPTASLA